MSENTKATENIDIAETAEHTTTKYTLNYVLEQIENLQKPNMKSLLEDDNDDIEDEEVSNHDANDAHA